MATIEKRRVDNKGRVSLQLKGKNEVFVFKKGSTILLSEDKMELEKLIDKFEDIQITSKLQALKEWFNIIEDLEGGFPSQEEMDKKISIEITKDNQNFIEDHPSE